MGFERLNNIQVSQPRGKQSPALWAQPLHQTLDTSPNGTGIASVGAKPYKLLLTPAAVRSPGLHRPVSIAGFLNFHALDILFLVILCCRGLSNAL